MKNALRPAVLMWLVMSIALTMLPVYSLAQAVPTGSPTVSAPATPDAPSDRHTGSQVAANAVVVMLLNTLKKSKWFPWLSSETAKLNKLAAVLLAGAAALGVHTSFDHSAGVLTITGLNLATIATTGWVWLKSYAFQQTIYGAAFKSTTPVPAQPAQAAAAGV